jgi:2-oxoglutarate ferredoxin oxidoreductase subunit alpha
VDRERGIYMGSENLLKFKDDISIVLCGEAGQGIQTVEYLLTRILKIAGYNVFSTKEFMSRIRGGSNSTSIRVSSERVSAPVDRIDILIPFSRGAVKHVGKRISEETVVLGEEDVLGDEYRGDKAIYVPLSKIASEVGGRIYLNTVAVGMLLGLFGVDPEILDNYLKRQFSSKGESVVQKNLEAAKRGYQVSDELPNSAGIGIKVKQDPQTKDNLIISGTDAVGMGAIAGGCNFTAFYPMSPSTGVSVFLCQQAAEFGIVAEQAEDEISAINMAIGAWYAGARAMVSTSGGGFALMVEGLSLAGILETPVVIHLAQRPGPATGLPTRTEQGDLSFALYSGHGNFPRIMLAPGTVEDAFYLTQKAFNLADRYQVPVIILTDQYMLDSYYNVPSLDPSGLEVKKHIVQTDKEYKRYKLTEDGISPRGIPGFGDGLVCVDSDEHDEEGHITEDFDVRINMVDKRLKKLDLIKESVIPPKLLGAQDYKTLIVGWGSTYSAIREALERLKRDDVAFLHFMQVYPLHPDTANYLGKAENVVFVENNATSQFGQLIKLHTGLETDKKILKYNGLPFSIEEIKENLESTLG